LVVVEVPTSVAVTVTSGTLEPDVSETTPTIPPVVNCARRIGWLDNNTAIAQTSRLALKQACFVMM
jgi:hypothetical protein